MILLDFWATWCGPCKVEIPWFVEFQTKYGAKGLQVVGVSVDDTADKLDAVRREACKMNYPVLQGLDHDDVQDAYGPLLGIPVSVVISRDGKICAQRTPGLTVEGRVRETRSVAAVTSAFASMYDRTPMLKGFTHARLACGCRITFREGVEGSPVTVVVDQKSPACTLSLHVRDLPLYDYREALRPSTRLGPPEEEEFEEEG